MLDVFKDNPILINGTLILSQLSIDDDTGCEEADVQQCYEFESVDLRLINNNNILFIDVDDSVFYKFDSKSIVDVTVMCGDLVITFDDFKILTLTTY